MRRMVENQDDDQEALIRELFNEDAEELPSPGADSDGDARIDSLNQQDKKILSMILRGVDVMEVHSPVRVAAICSKFGLTPGVSLDLKNGWDFDKAADRREAVRKVLEDKPSLLIGSPPCTWFSMLQELNIAKYRDNPEWQAKYQLELEKAIRHVKFCCQLYRLQMKDGRYWLHEHPWSARSWQLPCIQELEKTRRTLKVQAHMCEFNLRTWAENNRQLDGYVKKPIGFWGNSWCIADELDRRCRGGHVHTHLLGGRAAPAAIYSDDLCAAICKGLQKQLAYDKTNKVCSVKMSIGQLSSLVNRVGVQKPLGKWPDHWEDTKHEQDGGDDSHGARPQHGVDILKSELNSLLCKNGEYIAVDDVTGAALDPKLVKAGRKLEMEYFKKRGVYTRVPRSHQKNTGGKIITVRWVDTNKGDEENPEIRCRLVGQEYARKKDDSLYAATPPLEALRVVLSWAATISKDGKKREVMVNDVSWAYFYAKCARDLCI